MTRRLKRQARALFAGNRLSEARELYLQLCRVDPDDPDNWAMAGLTLGRLGQIQEAASCLERAIALRPGFAEARYNLGKARREMGHLEAAVASYEAALQLRPDWPDALFNLGNVFDLLGRLHQAETCYRRVLSVDPGYLKAYKALGNVLVSLGNLDDAMGCFDSLGQLDPEGTEARIGRAKVLERRGEIEEASAIARQLIESGTRNPELDFLYASMCGPEDAIALLEPWLAAGDPGIEPRLRATLHFRLGDSYDRQGDYRRAFDHYRTANRLKARAYDLSAFSSFVGDVISVFTPEFMSAAPRATHGFRRPIFILGMPRSGTTLTEQILSSHPDVFGAGELEEVRSISLEMLKTDERGRIPGGSLDGLTAEACDRYAARYLAHIDGLADGSAHVTDKMPQNFIGAGVIALLFPEARIIHCRRNPIDTCLSCFFNDFGAAHDYANELETLGGYYRQYQRIMRHWREVLNIPMLEIDYESLVADPEAMTRTLLDYCGLEWNEQCLRFHDNRRVVSTSSYDQVRKPIHSRSIGRWQNYQPYVQPLIDALESG